MKFLILLNNDSDGVGQTAINLSNNLKKLSHETQVRLLHTKNGNQNIKIIKRSFFLRIIAFLFNLLKIKKISSYKKNFLELFWFGNTTIKLKSIKKDIEKSDVIIIFTFYKLISKKIFEEIMKYKKVILLRPLDIELATGGCHFNGGCQNFTVNCDGCPKLNFLNILNITKKNLIAKKKIVNKYHPKVLVQNSYVKKIFDKSSIFKEAEMHIARLDVRKERKNYYTMDSAREILGLDRKERIILFGAFDLAAHHKGGHLLLEALKFLENKYFHMKKKGKIFPSLRILTMGKKNKFEVKSNIIKWTHLDLINSDKKLNLLYRASDLLACPSLQCFAPHIVTEAVENKLPVVSFDVGVAQDDVKHGVNGLLVPCYDVPIFAQSLYDILYDEVKRKNLLASLKNHNPMREEDEATTIINYSTKLIKRKN